MPVGSMLPAEDYQDIITSNWFKQPKFLERIRNPKLTLTSLEKRLDKQHLELVTPTDSACNELTGDCKLYVCG
jgi:hypothetical protein